MRGGQKVCSLVQLTTEYEHGILSLFNIVPSNRNALGPAILQSPYSIVEQLLILVLQPVSRGADNIIVVSKFPSFYEFLQFWKQIEVTIIMIIIIIIIKSSKYDGWRSSSKPSFRMAVSACDDV